MQSEPLEQGLLKQMANNIRQYRLEKSLSQSELAELCSLHRTYLGQVERAEINISIRNLLKISMGLGVPIHCLLEKSA